MDITHRNGEKLSTGIDHNADKLRGERINEIVKLLKDETRDKKEKGQLGLQSLDWCMTKIHALHTAHEAMQQPGKWNKSLISLGFTNGLTMAMAIFLEEQGTPPYRKVPEKLDGATWKLLEEKQKEFMINLVIQLESIICMDEAGKPKNYSDAEGQANAWIKWRNDTVDKIGRCQFDIPEVNAAVKRIRTFNENLQKKESDD